jgi:quinohemoprotein ethanol dehydrogenase
MAYSPKTGLVYIPAREEGMVMSGHPEYKWRQGDTNLGSDAAMGVFTDLLPKDQQEEMKKLIAEQAEGHPLDTREALIAWDPVTQKERWRIPVGMGDWAGGGVLTTAGNLVVQGHSDGMLTFYRADTGEKLGEVETGTGIMAGPITYELDGEQYIAVLAGFGGAIAPSYPAEAVANRRENYGRILAFKLGGGKTPLPPLRQSKPTPEPPVLPYYTEKLAAQGEEIFLGTCAGCHLGYGEQRHSAYPDLHRLPPETHAVFDSIVLGGRLKQAGMASFADLLTPDQVKAIHAYLVREQRKLRAEEIAASGSTTR